MKIEEYKKLLAKESSPSKYHNKKVEFRGITFDSIKERDYYIFLLDRMKRGEITDLKLQVPITIQEAFTSPDGKRIKAITYIADFVYKEKGVTHIVDTKGFKTDVYKLKKTLLAYRGVYIEEV